MLKFFAIIALFFGVASAALTASISIRETTGPRTGNSIQGVIVPTPTQCGGAVGNLLQLQVDGCTALPCGVKENSEIVIDWSPANTHPSSTCTLTLVPKNGTPEGISIDCGPLSAGTRYTLTVTIVDTTFYSGDVDLNVEVIGGQGLLEVCLSAPLVYPSLRAVHRIE